MKHHHTQDETASARALDIALLTVSDTRVEDTDASGRLLADRIVTKGHRLADKRILPDDIYRIRALLSKWIADDDVQVVIVTGGTGLTHRDCTPEAVLPLLDKEIRGFGELFRQLSFAEIGASTIQSRVVAGMANGTYIFCIPGSTAACRLAWDAILESQLDAGTRPCNFVRLMPRLKGS